MPSLLFVGIPWRVGGIWMHNLRYYVGSGDVPEQIQFDGGTYTCRCGQKSAKFLVEDFCKIVFYCCCWEILVFFFFCSKFQTSG